MGSSGAADRDPCYLGERNEVIPCLLASGILLMGAVGKAPVPEGNRTPGILMTWKASGFRRSLPPEKARFRPSLQVT